MRKYGEYPSVTTVTSIYTAKNRFVQQWLQKPENKLIVKDSTYFGNKCHKFIEKTFKNEEIPISEQDETYNFFQKHFLPFINDNKDKMLLCESSLINDDFQIGGTVDLFLSDGTVVDFKTSGKPKSGLSLEAYKMQISAYAAMIKLNYPNWIVSQGLIYIAIRSTDKIQKVLLDKDYMTFYLAKFMMYREEFYNTHGF